MSGPERTEVTAVRSELQSATQSAIQAAAHRLVEGGLVAFPTETVYGLGADASQAAAVQSIYRVKGRPADHPLIVHVLDEAQAQAWAQWPARAHRLAQAFWPGPLTLILPRLPGAPAWACAGQDSIGLRSPAHPVARALLEAFSARGGQGVAAPSANRFGRISPTTASHVVEELGTEAAWVLDGGACEVGLESTIVDLSRAAPVLLRPGAVGLADLQRVLGEPVAVSANVRDPFIREADAPRASGTLAAHYAPRTPLELLDGRRIAAAVAAEARRPGQRIAVWVRDAAQVPDAAVVRIMPVDATQCARMLYATLRELDASGATRILVESPPGDPDWAAVADRLTRAAAAHAGAPDSTGSMSAQ
jgi:L-threonylcarbamoyladenylate synthase